MFVADTMDSGLRARPACRSGSIACIEPSESATNVIIRKGYVSDLE